jgi:hypothetical protein
MAGTELIFIEVFIGVIIFTLNPSTTIRPEVDGFAGGVETAPYQARTLKSSPPVFET